MRSLRSRVSRASLLVFTVLLALSGFLTAAPGGGVGWYGFMFACALVALVAGPCVPRVLAAVALVISLFLIVADYRAGTVLREGRRAVSWGRSTNQAEANTGR